MHFFQSSKEVENDLSKDQKYAYRMSITIINSQVSMKYNNSAVSTPLLGVGRAEYWDFQQKNSLVFVLYQKTVSDLSIF